MLGRVGLGVVGKNVEFQGKCQFGGVCRNLVEKNRNTGQIWVTVTGTEYHFEPGVYLRKIELGAGHGLAAPVFMAGGTASRAIFFRLPDGRCNNSLGSSKIRRRHRHEVHQNMNWEIFQDSLRI